MRQEIELFLGNKSVEFNEPPEILFSYIRTDYTDPTVLRNSYSKTLTIEGTPNNNQIFNSIYHLDKISDYGTFNPAKRMEFQLFSNGDILEQGYAKLDKISPSMVVSASSFTIYHMTRPQREAIPVGVVVKTVAFLPLCSTMKPNLTRSLTSISQRKRLQRPGTHWRRERGLQSGNISTSLRPITAIPRTLMRIRS